jgi:nucleotide-binding universal stress UspA family protein
MLPFKKILYPTDFSDPSYEALNAANELALHFSAELCVVHVVSPGTTAPADLSGSNFKVLEEMERAARESLKEMVKKRIPKQLLVRQIVALGGAHEEIIQVSEKERVDLIVIATHGQTGWRHFVFGSVAEQVVRLAPCPVLTIRSPQGKAISGNGIE